MLQHVFIILCFVSNFFSCGMDCQRGSFRWLEANHGEIISQAGEGFYYLSEYQPRVESRTGRVKFPMCSVDSVPIENCGKVRFFITSALPGNTGDILGQMLEVKDPFERVGAVRAISPEKNELYVYIGFGATTSFATKNNKNPIFKGKVLAIVKREISGKHGRDRNVTLTSFVSRLKWENLVRENKINLADQEQIYQMLSDRVRTVIYNKNDFYFPTMYWPSGRSKLGKIDCSALGN